MTWCWPVLALLGLGLWAHEGSAQEDDFTNQWAVHIEGGPEVARTVAEDLGYGYGGQVGSRTLQTQLLLY